MTTHILEVAERMADRIGVIAGGRLIAEGTLDELRIKAGRGETSLEDTSSPSSPSRWPRREPPGDSRLVRRATRCACPGANGWR